MIKNGHIKKLTALFAAVLILFGVWLGGRFNTVAHAEKKESETTAEDIPQELSDLQNADGAKLDYWAENLARFDGRDFGYITPARNQGGKFICWAYTAIGAVEAAILREGIDPSATRQNLNLDEIAAAYMRYNRDGEHDPLFLTSNDKFSNDWNQGAHADEAFMAMTQGYSPVDQKTSDMPNDDDEIKSAISESKYFVQGYNLIPNDRQAIKRAILQYGSVTMEYKSPSYYQNYLYHSDGRSLGHASLIVGWDDNVDSSLFSPDHPQGNGAWIVKNSWGSYGFLKNGAYCFYLSYDSYLGNSLYAVDTALKSDYPNLYYYDGQITDNSTTYVTDAHGAIFEAKLSGPTEKERLKAVVFGCKNKKLTAEVKIYRHLKANPGNVNDKINKPDAGQLAADKKDIYFENPGLYTVDLDAPVELEQGEYFSVVISGKDESGNPLDPLYGYDGNESVNDMTYRLYGGEWTSMKDSAEYADSANSKMCARIRAITDTIPRESGTGNDLQYARVEIPNRLLYYEKGRAQVPELTVYFGGEKLQNGRDYEVTLQDNLYPGLATVKITGKNGYYGTRTTTFEVAKPQYPPGAPNEPITVYNNVTYLHQVPLPDGWEWAEGNLILENGLSYFSYQMRYTDDDADCYRKKTCSVKVNKINADPPEKTDISEAVATVTGEYTYTGSAIIPTVKVTYLGLQLNAGVDYTVACQDNVNAGQATAVITGTGLYRGEKRLTFEIKKADYPNGLPDGTITVSRTAKTLGDVPLSVGWRWKDAGQEIGGGIAATAVYEGPGKDNYNFTEVTVQIARKAVKDISKISVLKLGESDFVYDGTGKTPEVIALDGDFQLKMGIDFTAAYKDNVNAGGNAAVTVTGINDYEGSVTLNFNIEKAQRRQFAVSLQGWTFGQGANTPEIYGGEEAADITYLYGKEENGEYFKDLPYDAGKYWVKAVIGESQNYFAAESKAQFEIAKAGFDGATRTIHLDKMFESLSDIALPEGFVWDENSLVAAEDGNILRATAVYTGGNYDIEKLEFEIIIGDAEQKDQAPDNTYIIWVAAIVPSVAVAGAAAGFAAVRLRRKRR